MDHDAGGGRDRGRVRSRAGLRRLHTTNLPLDDLLDGQAWIACRYHGAEVSPEHGGPARLLVTHLYLWKSAKWVRGIQLLLEDEPGFWETVGYHDYVTRGASSGTRATDRPACLAGRNACR
jgi:DMSO/TMAO reductase YedYZ molybdopterin-dependent catalytic subunit